MARPRGVTCPNLGGDHNDTINVYFASLSWREFAELGTIREDAFHALTLEEGRYLCNRDQETCSSIAADDLAGTMDEVREGAPQSREGPVPLPPALRCGEFGKDSPVGTREERSQDRKASLSRTFVDEETLSPFPTGIGYDESKAVLDDDDRLADEHLLKEVAKEAAGTDAGDDVPISSAEESSAAFGHSCSSEEDVVDEDTNDSAVLVVSPGNQNSLVDSKDSTVEAIVHFEPPEPDSVETGQEKTQAICTSAFSEATPEEFTATSPPVTPAEIEPANDVEADEDVADDAEKIVAPLAEAVKLDVAGKDVGTEEDATGDLADNFVVLPPAAGDYDAPVASEKSFLAQSIPVPSSEEAVVQPPVTEPEAGIFERGASVFGADVVDLLKQSPNDAPGVGTKRLVSQLEEAVEPVLETGSEREPMAASDAEDTGPESHASTVPQNPTSKNGATPSVSTVNSDESDADKKPPSVREELVAEVAEVSEPHMAEGTEGEMGITDGSEPHMADATGEGTLESEPYVSVAVEGSEPHAAEESTREVLHSQQAPEKPIESSPEKSEEIISNDNGSQMLPAQQVAHDANIGSALSGTDPLKESTVSLSPKKLDIPAVFLGTGESTAEKLSPIGRSSLSPARKLEVPAAFMGGIDGAVNADLAAPDLGTPKRLVIPSAFGGDAARSPTRIQSPSTKSSPSELAIPVSDDVNDGLLAVETELVPFCEPTISPSKEQFAQVKGREVTAIPDVERSEGCVSSTNVRDDPKATVADAATSLSPEGSQSEQRYTQPTEKAFALPYESKYSKAQLLEKVQRIDEELVSVKDQTIGTTATHVTPSPPGVSLGLLDDELLVKPHSASAGDNTPDRFDTPPAAPVNMSLHSDPGALPMVPHVSVVVPVEIRGSLARLEAPDDEIEADSHIERVASAGTTKPDPPVSASKDVESPAPQPISIFLNYVDEAQVTPSETTPEKSMTIGTSPQSGKTNSPTPSPANSESVLSSCGACLVL